MERPSHSSGYTAVDYYCNIIKSEPSQSQCREKCWEHDFYVSVKIKFHAKDLTVNTNPKKPRGVLAWLMSAEP